MKTFTGDDTFNMLERVTLSHSRCIKLVLQRVDRRIQWGWKFVFDIWQNSFTTYWLHLKEFYICWFLIWRIQLFLLSLPCLKQGLWRKDPTVHLSPVRPTTCILEQALFLSSTAVATVLNTGVPGHIPCHTHGICGPICYHVISS
jgi:hypothetical protein